MKKLLFLSFIMVAIFASNADAQRNVKATQFITNTDVAGADTIAIFPKEYNTVVFHTLTDSVHYVLQSTSQCSMGDMITFVIISDSGTKFKTLPEEFQTTGADSLVTVTADKRAVQSFIFDGTYFVQKSLVAQ